MTEQEYREALHRIMVKAENEKKNAGKGICHGAQPG